MHVECSHTWRSLCCRLNLGAGLLNAVYHRVVCGGSTTTLLPLEGPFESDNTVNPRALQIVAAQMFNFLSGNGSFGFAFDLRVWMEGDDAQLHLYVPQLSVDVSLTSSTLIGPCVLPRNQWNLVGVLALGGPLPEVNATHILLDVLVISERCRGGVNISLPLNTSVSHTDFYLGVRGSGKAHLSEYGKLLSGGSCGSYVRV